MREDKVVRLSFLQQNVLAQTVHAKTRKEHVVSQMKGSQPKLLRYIQIYMEEIYFV